MKIKHMLFVGLAVLMMSCSLTTLVAPETPTPPPTDTPQPTATLIPTDTLTPTATLTPSLTPTVTLTPTPTWVVAGPGDVTCPILLYHHIEALSAEPYYDVPPEQFAQQMQALYEWGYTTITITQLATAITTGAPLPPRPIVITFDDGNMSVFDNAFPIMQQYGFVGVNYIVANRLESVGYLGKTELDQLYAAGWEVGSHSYTHADLTLNHNIAPTEIRQSRLDLKAALGQPVNTFAYPFGSLDDYLYNRTSKWGYLAAVGLGKQYVHNQYSLFYLSRIEIKQAYSLQDFGALLPWSSPP